MNAFIKNFFLSVIWQLVAFLVAAQLIDQDLLFLRVFVPALLASSLAVISKLPKVWVLSNALFAPLLLLGVSQIIPPSTFLLIALGVASLHLPALWTRVPYYPTPPEIFSAIEALIPKDKPCRFLDIGCGMGDLLRHIARHRPLANCEGVELAILPYLVSSIKSLFIPNMKVSYRSFWAIPFSQYDFVYAFLSPAPMPGLRRHLANKGAPMQLFISNSFPLPDMECEHKVVSEKKGGELFLYREFNNSSEPVAETKNG